MVAVAVEAEEKTLAEKLSALRDPATYNHAAHEVHALGTHYAWIFFAGAFAYKLKKPMHVERMDNRSLAARRHACYAELQLNRRLAPHVYLDVVPLLVSSSGTLSLHGAGEPAEWLVKMRRLSNSEFLDKRIRGQRLDLHDVHNVGELLAEFYRSRPASHLGEQAYFARLHSQVAANHLDMLSPELDLPVELVHDVAHRQQSFLTRHASLIAERAAQQKIVEGHGDLRPEHIHLGPPTCVIDCLEFDRDLRLHDPLEELAYLLIECEMLDATLVGREILEIYATQNETGLNELLLKFYCSHRASNRAKLVAWHLRDPSCRTQSDWRTLAERYLLLAHHHLDGL